MTVRQKRNLAGVSLLVAGAVTLAAGTLLVARSYSADARRARTIELVADCMSFRLRGAASDDPAEDNPVLRVRAGERVEIVLRNDDHGMKHDLAIPELGLHTAAIAAGETAVLRFTAPSAATLDYLCTLHPKVMRGRIVVEP